MADKILFELASPAKLIVSEAADMVVVPGTEGHFGALARHAPMIATVRPGVVDIHDGGRVTNRIFVAGGFAEVTEERLTVLAEEAVPVLELTREMADERLASARAAVAAATTDRDREMAKKQMDIALAMDAAAD